MRFGKKNSSDSNKKHEKQSKNMETLEIITSPSKRNNQECGKDNSKSRKNKQELGSEKNKAKRSNKK